MTDLATILDILRRYLPDAADSQLPAFEDTWHG